MPEQRIPQRYFRRPDLDTFLRSLFPNGDFGYRAQYGSYILHVPRVIEQVRYPFSKQNLRELC